MPDREFDIVVYGASGFVGRQAARYLAARPGLRVALAGRDRTKLEAAANSAGGSIAGILAADAHDAQAIDAIVARTRAVLNTAGPFALYGNAIVDACVRMGTHYVDITGETPWMAGLIERYHERASGDGTRIVPACGFDSIPSDIGSFFTARSIQRELGAACAQVKGYFKLFGGFNGGTIASLLNLTADPASMARAADPFILSPADARGDAKHNRDPVRARYDENVRAWTGPFFMGPVNTRVVRRSAALYASWNEPYGGHFRYQEYLKFGNRATAIGATAAAGLFQAAVSQPVARRAIVPLLPKPGSGPSERTMARSFFKCELVGTSDDGRTLRTVVRDTGDPSNAVTVKCVCESALALVQDEPSLPGGATRGGVLTPATAFGDVLIRRLRDAGMTIEALPAQRPGGGP